MTDQLLGWLHVLLGALRLLPMLAGTKPTRRHRWRVRYWRWKLWGLERERFELTDDRQS
jgi:hypothetical protein